MVPRSTHSFRQRSPPKALFIHLHDLRFGLAGVLSMGSVRCRRGESSEKVSPENQALRETLIASFNGTWRFFSFLFLFFSDSVVALDCRKEF